MRLYAEGREPSPITISAALGNNQARAYLGTLTARVAAAVDEGVSHSIESLVTEILDLAHRRALLRAAEQVHTLANSPSEIIPTQALQAKLEQVLLQSPEIHRPIKTAADIALETLRAAEKIYNEGEPPGVRSGFEPFDQLVGQMMPGDLIVIGGATSQGKTALAQQIAFEVARSHPVLIHSMEMSARHWNDRYITQLTGIPAETLECGPYTDRHFELMDQAWRTALRHLSMVISDQKSLTPSQILSSARRVKRRFGLSLLVLDHLQFIRPSTAAKEGPAAIAEITSDLKSIAALLEVPIILVSHLNRDTAKRDNYRPSMSDLYGSSSIEKDADVVLFVHRLAYWLRRAGPGKDEDVFAWEAKMRELDGTAELILTKRRRGAGYGVVTVGWDADRTMFTHHSA